MDEDVDKPLGRQGTGPAVTTIVGLHRNKPGPLVSYRIERFTGGREGTGFFGGRRENDLRKLVKGIPSSFGKGNECSVHCWLVSKKIRGASIVKRWEDKRTDRG